VSETGASRGAHTCHENVIPALACSALLLDPRVRPHNLQVLTGAQAVRVLWEQSLDPKVKDSSSPAAPLVAAGVEVLLEDGSKGFIRAAHLPSSSVTGATRRGDVILAAGALGVPALLQRSGVGHREVLKVGIFYR
jgi:choline dehydrogenase-like flavoprotein